MIRVAVGIDIGTSYTKAAARAKDGTIVRACRVPSSPGGRRVSPTGLLPATPWWTGLKTVTRALLRAQSASQVCVESFCVSAIAPTLIVFDAQHRQRAYGILYSSLPNSPGESSFAQNDRKLTDHRLGILSDIACKQRFESPCVTDLVGYLNWCLTGELTINSVSLAQMGMVAGARDCEHLSVANGVHPRLVAPGSQVGSTNEWSARNLGVEIGIPVCGGCPDTLASVAGAGLKQASETMLYLGTFGSLLRLKADLDAILESQATSELPFEWLLSIPGLGPEIERLSSDWFGQASAPTRLKGFDLAAADVEPGACGSLFLVPRWKNGLTQIGEFELVADRSGDTGDTRRKARAALEGIGYAVRAVDVSLPSSIKASGGGARSRIWLAALSAVLETDIQTQDMSWEAAGTSDIAARMVWKTELATRIHYHSPASTHTDREDVEDNFHRAMSIYSKQGWL